jgi:hypothetical protein
MYINPLRTDQKVMLCEFRAFSVPPVVIEKIKPQRYTEGRQRTPDHMLYFSVNLSSLLTCRQGDEINNNRL